MRCPDRSPHLSGLHGEPPASLFGWRVCLHLRPWRPWVPNDAAHAPPDDRLGRGCSRERIHGAQRGRRVSRHLTRSPGRGPKGHPGGGMTVRWHLTTGGWVRVVALVIGRGQRSGVCRIPRGASPLKGFDPIVGNRCRGWDTMGCDLLEAIGACVPVPRWMTSSATMRLLLIAMF